MAEKMFSPKEFLKSRRPDRFSDTVTFDTPVLDRSIMEYHLETLTSRSEEQRFEGFARGLLERTVCPNLIPHTGPSGGGDSKVDSETYPVAEALALGWYVGDGNTAATERWAFAFSTMKKWRPKVESDVKKLVATGRGYTKAFFVSSQYIRDKKRAEVEDALRNKHGIDVRIFDRTWILDKVFGGRLEKFAIDQLGIENSIRRESRKGPRDTAREEDLQKVEDRIAIALCEQHRSPDLVEACLAAADLARSMECPREKVEGFYARADRMAKECGTPHQRIQVAYDIAWTTFWWYEDYPRFIELYTEVENEASESRNAYDLELWTNCFACIYTVSQQTKGKDANVNPQRRARVLYAALDRVISAGERPSASLQARTQKLQVQLLLATDSERPEILQKLAEIVVAAEGLIGYPFEPLVEIVTEMGKLLGNLSEYSNLFEVVVTAESRRKGEVSAARMLLLRGSQQIDSGQFYESIRTLGRAMGRLYKNESREDAIRALYLCSHAYERVGLLWAARGTMLAASNVAAAEFWNYENVTPQQAMCYSRLKWLELKLGRIGHLLAWHEVGLTVESILNQLGHPMRRLRESGKFFDPIFGMLLLRADLWELARLTKLPEALDHLGLPLASAALFFALGYEEKITSDLLGMDATGESRREFFWLWRDQPAKAELPLRPLLNLSQIITLESRIAGCQILVNHTNAPPCAELAESLLASLEAFLATAMTDRIMAHEPRLEIKIRLSDFADPPFNFDATDKEGIPSIEIRCRSFEPHKLSVEEQRKLKDRLFEVLAHVFSRVFLVENLELLLTRLFRDDRAPQRALDFATSFVVLGSVLGDKPKTNLDDWTSNLTDYPLLRNQPWDGNDRAKTNIAVSSETTVKPAARGVEPPPEIRDLDSISHKNIHTVSVIRTALWNEASWTGIAFLTANEASIPPILALMFENLGAASKIFRAWRSEFGESDAANKLRVSIIRKISRENPNWYRIVLGSEPASCFANAEISRVAMVARIHTMTPSSAENLERFLTALKESQKYLLAYGLLEDGSIKVSDVCQLEKSDLVVRDAWEVGPNEVEAVAIRSDDNPIIPVGVKNAPIDETLKRIRLQQEQPSS